MVEPPVVANSKYFVPKKKYEDRVEMINCVRCHARNMKIE